MNRRGFLQSCLTAGVAPYVITTAGLLMPVRQIAIAREAPIGYVQANGELFLVCPETSYGGDISKKSELLAKDVLTVVQHSLGGKFDYRDKVTLTIPENAVWHGYGDRVVTIERMPPLGQPNWILPQGRELAWKGNGESHGP